MSTAVQQVQVQVNLGVCASRMYVQAGACIGVHEDDVSVRAGYLRTSLVGTSISARPGRRHSSGDVGRAALSVGRTSCGHEPSGTCRVASMAVGPHMCVRCCVLAYSRVAGQGARVERLAAESGGRRRSREVVAYDQARRSMCACACLWLCGGLSLSRAPRF